MRIIRDAMTVGKGLAACFAGVLFFSWAAPPLRAESPIALTVRVYNSVSLSPHEIAAVTAAAGPILRDTGADVTFRICERHSDDPAVVVDLCDDTLKPHEVVVRVIDAPRYNLQLD